MRSQGTPRFWQAKPNHPSLRYRRLEGRENLVTVRSGGHYRALGLIEPGIVVWVWIGPHADYNHLVRGYYDHLPA